MMPLNTKPYFHFVVPLFCLLAATGHGDMGDIACLKSIKDSLEDPLGHLKSSWDFNNRTEGFICGFAGVDCWMANENRVLKIHLGGMGLKGQFPREIKKCASLVTLDLSRNQLFGSIPADISKIFPYAVTIDLSNNNISGEIPPALANCSFLNVLKLDHNQLTGAIPRLIGEMKRLKTFSVGSNLLEGQVPKFVNAKFSAESYEDNPGLCGFPLEPCQTAPTFLGSMKGSFLVGFVLFFVLVFSMQLQNLLKSACSYLLVPERKKERRRTLPHHVRSRSNGRIPELLHGNNKETCVLLDLVSRMDYTDLCEATKNFCIENLIGSGSKGMTYKATLSNGRVIVVKRLFRTPQLEDHFLTELKTLGRSWHRNLVPLLGFCIEPTERLLVYNHMSNGTLYNCLHGSQQEPITWPVRLKIATGIARGMLWLHHSCKPRIVHLDICSKCVLLNKDFEPKISNFWEAVLLRSDEVDLSSKSFYLGADFWESSLLKQDVYWFGILLLELITGQDCTQMIHFSTSGGYNNLDQWVTSLSETDDFRDLIDRSLLEHGFDVDIFQLLRIAYDCADPFQDQTPTMLQVYGTICAIGQRCGLEAGDYCAEREPEILQEI